MVQEIGGGGVRVREGGREGGREVISCDLRLQRCIEVCTTDRSVMDFRVR